MYYIGTIMPEKVYTFILQNNDCIKEYERKASAETKQACRLDVFLSNRELLSHSRSQVRKLILDGHVTVNGQSVKPGYQVKKSDTIRVNVPEPRPLDLVAEDLPLDILYEDAHLLVINKAVGMVVHPAPGHHAGTLVHALLHHCRSLSGIGGVQRPGIVHRLDRDTSGVMLVAKTDEAHFQLSEQLKARTLKRIYYALIHGRCRQLTGHIEAPIGRHRKDRKKMAVDPEHGRYALSHYQVLRQYPNHALLRLDIATGRTHQIRVHLKYIVHPVVGDPVYGTSNKNNLGMTRQALHAQSVRFIHPVSQERMVFETSLPQDIQAALNRLERSMVKGQEEWIEGCKK